MARPKLDAAEKRDKWITVRVNQEEQEMILGVAQKMNLSASGYLRKLGLNQKLKSIPPAVDRDAYRQITGIAKNINQLVLKINSGIYSEIPAYYYETLKSMIKEIGKSVLKNGR